MEVVGFGGGVEAGVGGHQDPGGAAGGQLGGERQDRCRAGAAVQEQERVAGAGLVDGDLDRGGARAVDGAGGGSCRRHVGVQFSGAVR